MNYEPIIHGCSRTDDRPAKGIYPRVLSRSTADYFLAGVDQLMEKRRTAVIRRAPPIEPLYSSADIRA